MLSPREFLGTLVTYRLVPEGAVDPLLRELDQTSTPPSGSTSKASSPKSTTAEPSLEKLAERLVRRGLLTSWQVKQILAGRARSLLLEGRYRLQDKIGEGGMGAVFRALDLKLERDVVLKIPRPDALKDARTLARFQREVVVNGRLQHPNIVRALDVGRDGNLHFIVMELVEGEDLHKLVLRQGPLAPAVAADYTRQAAEALHYAFLNGVIHRDLKPGNLLLSRDGRVKVLDMGLARLLDNDQDLTPKEREERQRLTRTGVVLGSIAYMSPEQAESTGEADIRSDIYSLGCSLYEMLTARPPFIGKGPMETLLMQVSRPAPDVAGLDVGLSKILKRMLEKNPDDRFQSPAEVMAALHDWLANPPSSATAPLPRLPLRADPSPMKMKSADAVTPASAGTSETNEELAPDRLKEIFSSSRVMAPSTNSHDIPPWIENSLQSGGPASGKGSNRSKLTTTKTSLKGPTKNVPPAATPRRLSSWGGFSGHMGTLAVVLGIVVGLVMLAVGISGWMIWEKLGETLIAINWPVEQREGAKLLVDGKPAELGPDPVILVAGDPGTRILQFTRTGFLPHRVQLELSRGERASVNLQWEPSPEFVRAREFAELKRRVTAAQYLDPSDPILASLKVALRDFAKQHPETKEGAEAIQLADALSSPLDMLAVVPQETFPTPLRGLYEHTAPKLSHWGEVVSLAFSPDAKLLVSGGRDQFVRVWDDKTGQMVAELEGHSGSVESIVFSPDGSRLYTSATQDSVRVWDTKTWKTVGVLPIAGTDTALAMSPSGDYLAVKSDKAVELWDLKNQKSERLFDSASRLMSNITYSPDGTKLAFGDRSGTIHLIKMDSLRSKELIPAHSKSVRGLAFASDSRKLASVSTRGELQVWDTTDLSAYLPRPLDAIAAESMLFRPGTDEIWIAGSVGVRVYDLLTPRKSGLVFLKGNESAAIAFTADGSELAMATAPSRIRLYAMDSDQEMPASISANDTAESAVISPDESVLAIASHSNVKLIDPLTGEIHYTLAETPAPQPELVFAPDGKWIAVEGDNGSIRLYDPQTGILLNTLLGHNGTIVDMAVSPDGKFIASAGRDGMVTIWDVDLGSSSQSFQFDLASMPYALTFSPNGKLLAVGTRIGEIRLYGVPKGNLWFTMNPDESSVRSIVFSPDGKKFVATFQSGTMAVMDVDTGSVKESISFEGPAGKAAYSPDGQMLYVADCRAGSIRSYDSGKLNLETVYPLSPVNFGTISDFQLTSSGRYGLVVTGDGSVALFRIVEPGIGK